MLQVDVMVSWYWAVALGFGGSDVMVVEVDEVVLLDDVELVVVVVVVDEVV